jgi:hypothetical protein
MVTLGGASLVSDLLEGYKVVQLASHRFDSLSRRPANRAVGSKLWAAGRRHHVV